VRNFYSIPGILHEDLRVFLESNFPKSSKKEKAILGVGDSKLGSVIAEEMKISCQHTGVVPEIIRGLMSVFLTRHCLLN
jgi:hypothetical protein